MSYALIELDTGNMVGFFPTERAALEEILDSIDRYGVDSVNTLGLAFNDPNPAGPVRRIAVGADLARRAQASLSPALAAPENLSTARMDAADDSRLREAPVDKALAQR